MEMTIIHYVNIQICQTTIEVFYVVGGIHNRRGHLGHIVLFYIDYFQMDLHSLNVSIVVCHLYSFL